MVVTWRQINKSEEVSAPHAFRVFFFGLLLGGLVASMVAWIIWR